MTQKIIRLEKVLEITGLSESSIYKQIRLGLFPSNVKLTARATGWDPNAISAWVSAKLSGASNEEVRALVEELKKPFNHE